MAREDCGRRIPIRYTFRAGANAICYSMKHSLSSYSLKRNDIRKIAPADSGRVWLR